MIWMLQRDNYQITRQCSGGGMCSIKYPSVNGEIQNTILTLLSPKWTRLSYSQKRFWHAQKCKHTRHCL